MKRPILIVFLLLLSFPATAQEAPAKTLRILSFNVRIWTRDRAVSMRWNACTVAGIRIIIIHSSWEKEIMDRTVEQVNAQLTGRDVACGDWNVGLVALNKTGLQMAASRPYPIGWSPTPTAAQNLATTIPLYWKSHILPYDNRSTHTRRPDRPGQGLAPPPYEPGSPQLAGRSAAADAQRHRAGDRDAHPSAPIVVGDGRMRPRPFRRVPVRRIGHAGGDGGHAAGRQCAERPRRPMALPPLAGLRHHPSGMQRRKVGAVGGGGCDGS